MTTEASNTIYDEPGTTQIDDDQAYAAALEGDNDQNVDVPGDEQAKAVAPETDPQQQEEAAGEETPKGEKERYVPYGALHEERESRKEIQAQLRQTQEQLQHLTGRISQYEGLKEELAAIRASRTQEQKQAEEAEFEDDPVGYMRKRVESLQGKLEERDQVDNQTKEQQEQRRQQQQQLARFQQDVSKQVDAFKQNTPDYTEAFTFLMNARLKEYAAMGVTDPAQQQQMFDQESMSLAAMAMQNQQNPGEVAYNLAKTRGYQPAKGGEAAQEDAGGDEKNEGDKTLTESLERLERGQQAAQTLSGGGVTPKGDVSLADLDNMTDAEFDALFADMAKSEGRGSIFDE